MTVATTDPAAGAAAAADAAVASPTTTPGGDNSKSTDSDDDSDDGDGGATDGATRRRRRRARSGEGASSSPDDPENTVVKVREGRSAEDEITGVSGSTRLEAKKQRRREGREAGRRRAPIVSEAEFLARRESVKREMVVRQRDDYTQIAVLEDSVLVEHYVARESQTSADRQRLPRQGPERPAEHGGRLHRHRRRPQRRAVRR